MYREPIKSQTIGKPATNPSKRSVTHKTIRTQTQTQTQTIDGPKTNTAKIETFDYRADANANISFIVFTHSHPAGVKARDQQRRFCRPLYEKHGIKHVFSVGRPSYDWRSRDEHIQGQVSTRKEIDLGHQLLKEHERHGDLLITPNRDQYRDKSEKLLSSLRYAVDQGVDFILKTDDEYCVNVEVAKRLIRSRPLQNEIFMGWIRWNGTEYSVMKGSDGTIAPFMSGWVFGLSQNLAKTIVNDDWVHSMLFSTYGTSSDDANLGKWVDYAVRTHNITVDHAADRKLMMKVPGVKQFKDSEVSMFVFTYSQPSAIKAREQQRAFCRPSYEKHGIKHVFSVGRPSFDGRDRNRNAQGQMATEKEIDLGHQLLKEHERHRDLLITPNRDNHQDRTDKLLSSLRYAISQGADFIFKTDDEYCVDVEVAKNWTKKRLAKNEVYLGWKKWKGTEYSIMKGSDGTRAPFMSGWVYGLSRNLAQVIVEDDWVHSMMFSTYGTSSDDANLGRWVDWASRTHNLTVAYIADRQLCADIPEINQQNATKRKFCNIKVAVETNAHKR
ncbi:hypothetical protein ACHAWF_018692 [Thalassiosira exigua]